MKQEILDAGWKHYSSPSLNEMFRKDGVYEKGNYWLIPTEGAKQVRLVLIDPSKLMDEGYNYPENFRLCVHYKGPQTIEFIEKLLDI